MGRRPDTPEEQKAKGFTRSGGRRKSKAVLIREARFARLTEVLTPLSSGAEVPPPAYLTGDGYEVALAVWKRLAPELHKTHRLPKETHDAFALYCCTYAEWLELDMDIKDAGRTQRIKNVSGSLREVDRPSIRHRQQAYQNLKEMWPKFGLTASDLYALFKDQHLAVQTNPGLFDNLPAQSKAAEAAVAEASQAPLPGGVIGSGKRYKSAPPTVN